MGRIIEGVWDCAYCGAKKVRGSLRECPQCGRPRDKNITFYIDNPQNYVFDEAKAKKAREGPDWLCEACDSLNPASANECIGCGTPRDHATKNYFQNQEARHAKKLEELRHQSAETQEDISAIQEDLSYHQEERDWRAFHDNYVPPKTPTPSQHKQNPWKKILLIGGVTLAIIAMIVGLVMLCMPKEVAGTVEGFDWSRTIEIEEYKTVREDGWSIPVGGREISRRQEIHHYDKVLDHYETKTREEQYIDHYEEYVTGYRDLGNGHFEEITAQRPVYKTRTVTYQEPVYKDVPIYQTKYTYDIDKWVHQSNKTTSGEDKSPYWSDYECKNKEREGSRSETYQITVRTEDGEVDKYSVSFETWQALQQGQTVKLKVSLGGHAELLTEGDD